ncbi:hypothetical protein AB0N38_22295 [Micromonospora aurantiaca]|nr:MULTISPECIES: hypothetical protein [Micromonospora]ADU06708.1 hypothetical protein ML5_1168 [Micromonospora sp. L5]MCO1615788.1 hypothetical protein [Micromonospora sp. CPM1]SCL36837.1 hypothetical protein GA0070615_3165 [Micromonospora aurantiaca]
MSMPLESVPFSELLRQPTETAERLARTRALRLRRRDAADLVLMSAERAEAEGEVVDLTARLLAGLARREPALVRETLPTVLPWMRFLPQGDAEQMTDEFIATAEAAAAVGSTAAVSQLLAEWRHTAEVHADPDLHRILAAPSADDFGPVTRPTDE